jgi:hypothetical protein
VHVEVGPLPSASARVWLHHARRVLGEARRGDFAVPADVLTEFERYLDEWDAAAAASETFRWQGQADPEVVEYLLHAWFNLAKANSRRIDAGEDRRRPPEAATFYRGLVRSLLDALAAEGRGSEDFAEELRTDWPGLGRTD